MKIGTLKGGYDCIIVPGAMDAAGVAKTPKICGSMMGLATATCIANACTGKTICCKFNFYV